MTSSTPLIGNRSMDTVVYNTEQCCSNYTCCEGYIDCCSGCLLVCDREGRGCETYQGREFIVAVATPAVSAVAALLSFAGAFGGCDSMLMDTYSYGIGSFGALVSIVDGGNACFSTVRRLGCCERKDVNLCLSSLRVSIHIISLALIVAGIYLRANKCS